jgi:hypothetical protein
MHPKQHVKPRSKHCRMPQMASGAVRDAHSKHPKTLVGGLLCENAPLAASCTTVSTFRTAPDPSLGMSLPDFAGVNGMPPRSRCNFPSIVWPTDGHAIKVTKQALPASIKLQTLHVQARMTPTARIPKLGRNQGLKCFIFVRGKP